MPRKVRDPISAVMQYFETAPIEVARLGLEVASEIIRRRSTRGPVAAPRAGNGQTAREHTPPASVTTTSPIRKRRQATTPALPGPTPTEVGE
jgi:hypothetical protein